MEIIKPATNLKEVLEKVKDFDKDYSIRIRIAEALENHKKFLERYPFRKCSEKIDLLTPEDIYKPGSSDDFSYCLEHELYNIARLGNESNVVWKKIRDYINVFKQLLYIAVDDKLQIDAKIDANWQEIPWLGGDKHVAKKIIWCYYPEDFLPILDTGCLENFVRTLGMHYGYRADALAGVKFKELQKLLLEFKGQHNEFKDWDKPFFTDFLFETIGKPIEY